jgi:hypothetical protein
VVNARDITARRETENKYRSVVENAIEGIFQTSPEGHYLAANPALVHIYGYESAAEMMADISNIAGSFIWSRGGEVSSCARWRNTIGSRVLSHPFAAKTAA